MRQRAVLARPHALHVNLAARTMRTALASALAGDDGRGSSSLLSGDPRTIWLRMSASRSRPTPARVRPAATDDVVSWLQIVREVEPAFGPMPDFDATLLRKIEQGNARCVRREGASPTVVDGGVLLGGVGDDRWIRWLAVRVSARGHGIGAALVADAIAWAGPACALSLDTFGADNPFGLPARRLYARFGFEAREMVGRGPEGGTRQRFVRPPTPAP